MSTYVHFIAIFERNQYKKVSFKAILLKNWQKLLAAEVTNK